MRISHKRKKYMRDVLYMFKGVFELHISVGNKSFWMKKIGLRESTRKINIFEENRSLFMSTSQIGI